MSLFKVGSGQWAVGRKSLALIAIIVSLAALAGCGFTPMYAQNTENAEIAEKLASVKISPIKTIIGQQYVNALEDVLDPNHAGVAKEYIIEAAVTKDVQALAIESDRTVTRYKVIITAEITLKDIATDKVLYKGQVRNQSDYDKVTSDYGTYVSENDTASRAIRELAQDTKIRIISALLK